MCKTKVTSDVSLYDYINKNNINIFILIYTNTNIQEYTYVTSINILHFRKFYIGKLSAKCNTTTTN